MRQQTTRMLICMSNVVLIEVLYALLRMALILIINKNIVVRIVTVHLWLQQIQCLLILRLPLIYGVLLLQKHNNTLTNRT